MVTANLTNTVARKGGRRIRSTSVAPLPSVDQIIEQLVDDVLRCVRETILGELQRANRPALEARKAPGRKRAHVPPGKGAPLSPLPLGGQPLARIEREAIRQTLAQSRGDRTAAARSLGIAVSTLYEKMKKYELSASSRASRFVEGGPDSNDGAASFRARTSSPDSRKA